MLGVCFADSGTHRPPMLGVCFADSWHVFSCWHQDEGVCKMRDSAQELITGCAVDTWKRRTPDEEATKSGLVAFVRSGFNNFSVDLLQLLSLLPHFVAASVLDLCFITVTVRLNQFTVSKKYFFAR